MKLEMVKMVIYVAIVLEFIVQCINSIKNIKAWEFQIAI